MSPLITLERVSRIYRASERVFLPGLGGFFEKAKDLDNIREVLSAKKLLSAYREVKSNFKETKKAFKNIAQFSDRAKFLRELIYKEDEFAVTALLNVSLTIDGGEFVAIAGPSGSGKSTLLNVIATLEEPSYGSVFFEGKDLNPLTEDERAEFRLKNLGFVFQAFNLIPVLSAFENIEYALILKGCSKEQRKAKTREALNFVGLSDCAHRRPNKLSGGQQQRVAIARALAVEPKVILADEPTANLDSKTAVSILDLMGKINKEKGTTFIFSSHDQLILSRARRVISLRDGAIVKEETKTNSLVVSSQQ